MNVETIVRGGRVVTPAGVDDTLAIAIGGGKIVALGDEAVLPRADRVIDASGKIVFPGAIDCHVHLGAEYDDWRGGPIAAAHAGLTTLVAFALVDDAGIGSWGGQCLSLGDYVTVRPIRRRHPALASAQRPFVLATPPAAGGR
jgi:predicted amidohydrolase